MDEILFDKVMGRIEEEKRRTKTIRRFFASSAVCLFAIISSQFVWSAFAREIIISGFGQYALLALSDIGAVIANWDDFAMTLLESFPALNAAGLLAELAVLMISIKFVLIYGKRTLAYGKH